MRASPRQQRCGAPPGPPPPRPGEAGHQAAQGQTALFAQTNGANRQASTEETATDIHISDTNSAETDSHTHAEEADLSSSSHASTELDPKCLGKDAAFQPFADKLTIYCDDTYIYIEADSLADHEMMVGITAWNQQVPLPQGFVERNAWRIPLYPVLADASSPTPGQGAMAVAINGVMIFNPTRQDGNYAPDNDPNLIGELDHCGGHSGRADDYHYHVAPNCIVDELMTAGLADDQPLAYALDGFPIYGYYNSDGSLPTDLDACGGEVDEAGNYHYHARPDYPYVNGCFSGELDLRLQPATHPVRPHGDPIHVLITAHSQGADGWSHLEFEYQGTTHAINYRPAEAGCYSFEFIDDISTGAGQRSHTYCR